MGACKKLGWECYLDMSVCRNCLYMFVCMHDVMVRWILNAEQKSISPVSGE